MIRKDGVILKIKHLGPQIKHFTTDLPTNVHQHISFHLITKTMYCGLGVFLSIKYNDGINKAIRLEITRAQLNPKPHLTKPHTPLARALPCQQCSLGNEEWVGVCDLMTCQQLARGSAAHQQTSPRARLQLNRSPSFPHVQKENRLFYSCVARRLRTGGGGEEAASQMAAVLLEHSTVYSPSGLVISFTRCVLREKEHKLMARQTTLYLTLWLT